MHSTAVSLPSSLARVKRAEISAHRARESLAPPKTRAKRITFNNQTTNYHCVIAGVYSSVMPRKVEKRETVPEQSEQDQQENEAANASNKNRAWHGDDARSSGGHIIYVAKLNSIQFPYPPTSPAGRS